MTISTLTTKNSYSGNGSNQTFAYGFYIPASTDIQVIVRSAAGIETVKAEGTGSTNYAITGVASASGGNIVFVTAPTNTETVTLRRATALTQGTDYVANDPFPAETHESALDKLTIIGQDLQEQVNRSLKISRTNTMTSTDFTTSAANRASKVLAFDSSGELSVTQELGTVKGNWAASTVYQQRDIVKDTSTNNIFIVLTAHTSSGSQPITTNTDAAKWSLLVDAASSTTSQTAAATSATAAASSATASASSASTASGHKDTATTKASEAASSATAAASSATSAAASFDSFDDRYLGAKSSAPSVDNDGNALLTGALYFNSSSNVMFNWTSGDAWVDLKPTADEQTKITALGADAVVADMALLATSTVIEDMGLLATSTVIEDMGLLANSATIADMAILATSDIVNDLSILATTDFVSDLNQLATSDFVSDLNALEGIKADVETVADNVAGITSFASRYRVASSDPSSSLDEGDLAYNSTSNVLKYYNGSAWTTIAASDVTLDDATALSIALG